MTSPHNKALLYKSRQKAGRTTEKGLLNKNPQSPTGLTDVTVGRTSRRDRKGRRDEKYIMYCSFRAVTSSSEPPAYKKGSSAISGGSRRDILCPDCPESPDGNREVCVQKPPRSTLYRLLVEKSLLSPKTGSIT